MSYYIVVFIVIGADWALNNVRTGGAGAIGWRVPYNENLAARIRSAASILLLGGDQQ